MQMSLGEADNGKAVAAQAPGHRTLRLCKIGQAWTDQPQTTCKAEWKTASEESALRFSAVGYFFGDALLQSPELKHVPIGLIESDLGGTMAEAWTPKEELSTIEGKAENSMFGIGPTTLYNGMIAPLGKIGLKGVVWYQGEGNSGDPATYPSKLTALIRGWRKQFQNPKLPFLIVQLPDYAPAWGDYYWQWMRDAQRQVADKTPDVGLVTAINTNDGLDLHPKPKQAIGQRAALLARQEVYGEKIAGHGPLFKAADVSADGVRVTFDTVGSRLAAVDPNDVRGFLLAGADGRFRRAKARILGDAVVLKSEFVQSPKFVRYAWAGAPNATLTNTDGLPAYPFRTDTLPMDSAGTQPQAGGYVLGVKGNELTVQNERVTSFTVKGRQFLSNETGLNSGVVVPGFLGPAGLGAYSELGPDIVQLGGEKNNVRISLDSKGSIWTFHNDENDGRTIRFNLSPIVKTSDLNNGAVTLTRPGATIKVSGVDKVDAGDGLPFLLFRVEPHSNATVKFEFGE
jgi:sialate O-acetylesterase